MQQNNRDTTNNSRVFVLLVGSNALNLLNRRSYQCYLPSFYVSSRSFGNIIALL